MAIQNWDYPEDRYYYRWYDEAPTTPSDSDIKAQLVDRPGVVDVSNQLRIAPRALMVVAFGYTLSSEEHGPRDLVRNAAKAEEVGFDFLSVSDHFHPWVSAQGHSPFVWSVLGGNRPGDRTDRGGSRA